MAIWLGSLHTHIKHSPAERQPFALNHSKQTKGMEKRGEKTSGQYASTVWWRSQKKGSARMSDSSIIVHGYFGLDGECRCMLHIVTLQ
jgi:hypothetical protein